VNADHTDTNAGVGMHALMTELFPICRSLTGPGLRQTLARLAEIAPFTLEEVPSGTQCFDWTVPPEWTIRDAWVEDATGERVIDFRKNNLHVVGYSEPVDQTLTLSDLRAHLHTLPELPNAIPYVTSYYSRYWGFCLSQDNLDNLVDGEYRAVIDATLDENGSLTYAELLIPGSSSEEILLSTYACHPSMANNELSGPVLTTWLAQYIMALPERRYSYRIVIVPETIGSITYISRHLEALKKNVVAGYVVTCVGGPDQATFLESRTGDTLADRAALHILNSLDEPFKHWTYARRASDERQYCSPGVELPVASVMRSKYHDYPEYHTSLDDLNFVRPEHMQASYDLYVDIIQTLETNRHYKTTVPCEPQLGPRGLYPNLGDRTHQEADLHERMALLAYADGQTDLIDIAERNGTTVPQLAPHVQVLMDHGLLEEMDNGLAII
jgi:aminopeptidase-like protein